MKRWIKQSVSYLWHLLAVTIIAVAITVQLGRELSPFVNDFRPKVNDYLSQRFGAKINMQELQIAWKDLQLQFIVKQLTIHPASGDNVLQVNHASLRLDILSSLLRRQLIWKHVVLHDTYMHAEQNSEGIWNLAGFSRNVSDKPMDMRVFDPSDWFILSERVELSNTHFLLGFRTGQSTQLSLPNVTIDNDDNFHRLEASIDTDGDNRILHFIVEGVGDPRNRETFSASGFLQLKRFPINELLVALPKQSLGGDDDKWQPSSHIDLQLWIDFLRPNEFDIKGHVTLNDVQLAHSGKPIIIAKSIDSSISGAIDLEDETSLSFSHINIDKNDKIMLPNVNVRASADQIAVQVDQIDLAYWVGWLVEKPFIKDATKQVLTKLSPMGSLTNVSLTSKVNDWQNFRLRSNIVDTHVAAWKKIPSFKGINGYIEATATQGIIELEADKFGLFAKTLFDHELQLAKTKGQIAWHLRPQQNSIVINSGLLHSDSNYGQANGAFYLDIPWTPHTRPSHVIVQVGLQNAKLKDYHFFLPKKLPENLQTWLATSIAGDDAKDEDGGKIPMAGLVYRGLFDKNRQDKHSLQFFADISQGAITYNPEWPPITDIQGQLIINNDSVVANIKHAKMYDANISDATIYWPGLKSKVHKGDSSDQSSIRKLHIKGTAKGPTVSGLRLLQESWLSTKVGTVVDRWTAEGDLEVDLTIDLPLLNRDMAPTYAVTVTLRDSTIGLQEQNLSLQNTNGEVTIDSRKGFLSPGIDSTLWGYPLAITLKNNIHQGSDHLSIEGRGRSSMQAVASWLHRPELLFASGESDFLMNIQIPLQAQKRSEENHKDSSEDNDEDSPMVIHEVIAGSEDDDTENEVIEHKQADNFTLTLQSDLTGIAIDLPPPFAKKASDQLPLNVLLSANNSARKYDIHFGQLGQLLLIQENEQPTSAVFRYQTGDIELKKGKFLIAGHSKTLHINQWQDVVHRYHRFREELADTPTKATDMPDITFDWSFDTVYLDKTILKDIYITANRKTDYWQIDINNMNTIGSISLFDDKRPTKVHFEKLHWPPAKTMRQETLAQEQLEQEQLEQEAINEHINTSVDQWAEADLSTIPPLDFSVDQLILSGKALGQWRFKLRTINNGKGIELNDIYGKIEELTFAGNDTSGGYFRWEQASSGSKYGQSQLIGVLKGGDIKPLLDKWQLSPLESKKSYLATTLTWSGSPHAFAVNKLIGDMTVAMSDGRFIRAQNNEATDLLRLFGLFNFDTWARRIRLDFSDLYKSGLSFDELKGNIEFDNGMIYLIKPLVVKGPSSDLKMAGKIDYEKQQIDTRLVATLPVSGNLTTLGIALAAGLPAAAGVYAISKIFKDQVDKVASLSYRIKGNWENPTIRFDKLFDEKAAKQAGQTVEKEKQAR